MAARAHWFEDEDAAGRPPAGGRRCGIRSNDDRRTANADDEPHVPERTCVLTRRKGTQGRADPARAWPGRRGRARRPRPGAGPRRLDRRRPRRARRRQRQGQAQGRARSARSRPTTSTSPPISASGPKQALRQTALDRLGMEARAGNLDQRLRPRRDRGPRRQGPPAASTPPMPARTATASARPGLAGRRRRAAGADIPRGAHYLVDGTWGAKMWYMSP